MFYSMVEDFQRFHNYVIVIVVQCSIFFDFVKPMAYIQIYLDNYISGPETVQTRIYFGIITQYRENDSKCNCFRFHAHKRETGWFHNSIALYSHLVSYWGEGILMVSHLRIVLLVRAVREQKSGTNENRSFRQPMKTICFLSGLQNSKFFFFSRWS